MRCKIILWVCISIFIPVLINFIIGLEHPKNISVVGDEGVWVQFYGSYIGGILTAIIGFWAMERSSHENAKNICISTKQHEITTLEHTLSNCVSLFDYSRVGAIALYLDEPSKYEEILQKLDEYLSKITTTANAWGVVYSNSTKQEIRDFQDVYVDCVNDLTAAINQVSYKIKLLKKADDISSKEIMLEINTIVGRYVEYNVLLTRLFNAAQRWIASEKQELQRLQNL